MKRVIGIYLAAGRSSRMGADKLRLPAPEAMLGSFALFAAVKSRLERTVVDARERGVSGWIHPALRKEPLAALWTAVACRQADRGQAHSLRCGLHAARSYEPDAMMIMLADQPCITAGMLDDLLARYAAGSASCVAACHAGIPRPPVIFGKERFNELARLSGDEGARRLIRGSQADQWTAVPFADPKLFYDADTEEEYRRLLPSLPAVETPWPGAGGMIANQDDRPVS